MAKKAQINKAYVEKFVAEHGFPEKGFFEDKKDLQKFYKHLSDEQLAEWIEIEGLSYTPAESAPINRMRMAMAILHLWHPKAPAKKKESKYAKYSNEDLMALALDKDVVFEVCDDEKILRMRAIMALRAAKVID